MTVWTAISRWLLSLGVWSDEEPWDDTAMWMDNDGWTEIAPVTVEAGPLDTDDTA